MASELLEVMTPVWLRAITLTAARGGYSFSFCRKMFGLSHSGAVTDHVVCSQ